MFKNAYKDKRVLVTGHTGFKGSWLSLWLTTLGADVLGYSLPSETSPSPFEALAPPARSETADVRDFERLSKVVDFFKPDIAFHLAAQAFVLKGYQDPLQTFETNVMGVANVLKACGDTKSVRAVVVVTSDKCYENKEWLWGYRERDRIGGRDPYSASKGCAELVVKCFRNSFFNPSLFEKKHNLLVASVRAGNVIGGGDWGNDRLVPDIMKSIFSGRTMQVRNPESIRPWQHVLDALAGYLLLGARLLSGNTFFADCWNFGPSYEELLSAGDLVKLVKSKWDAFSYVKTTSERRQALESNVLLLDSTKARKFLGWRPVWNIEESVEKTVDWYRAFYEENKVISDLQIGEYIEKAKQLYDTNGM